MGLGGESRNGSLVLRRTHAALGRAEVPLQENLHPREGAVWKSCDPHPQTTIPHRPLRQHLSFWRSAGRTSGEKMGKVWSKSSHQNTRWSSGVIQSVENTKNCPWNGSCSGLAFISHSKESTEYPIYVENYTGHLPLVELVVFHPRFSAKLPRHSLGRRHIHTPPLAWLPPKSICELGFLLCI